jgi:hydrogenase maturation protein HypF
MAVGELTGTQATRARARVRVHGTVQGVGFRPYVFRLANELGLAGYVLNDAEGVLLELEGGTAAIKDFLSRLAPEAPPLAVLERVESEQLEPAGTSGFLILESERGQLANAAVTPDTATCPDCLAELFDPADRRCRYPFINCTNCGPRFTIVRGVPYDRPLTTMAGFQMCDACRAEYEDPRDRRFHAQPNACPQCGPQLALIDAGDGALLAERDGALAGAVEALIGGAIVAVKGIGGYHLACRCDDERAVSRLRARKHREDKPFALMCADTEHAAALLELGRPERMLIGSTARPIVLARRRFEAPVAPSVAPGAPELGVMLPYSPLHHLLLAGLGTALVVTSGNVSDEPIAYRDEDASARLAGIADLLLIHDRPIETRTDDSVVRVLRASGKPRTAFVRRSRGYVPASLPLPGVGARRPLLACGAELKNTFCVAKAKHAWVSHHVGDLENYETLASFSEGVAHFQELFAVTPEVVAHDLHPDYLSTRYALELEGVELVGVQHHHAHLAACLAEHGELGKAIGAIYDGTGYGTDGTIWGGELLYGDLGGFERIGHLRAVRLPGGAAAIRQPWRMACTWLAEMGEPEATPEIPASLAAHVDPRRWRQVRELVRTGVASPVTSSVGRLFDAVAALCGIRAEINYEGQAAIELEACCDPSERGAYPLPVVAAGGVLVIDPLEALAALVADLSGGAAVPAVAARFHAAVAAATVAACARAASERGTETVVLSGGVFLNRRLLEATLDGLRAEGLRALTPERLPVNDGGISYGQAAVAAARGDN